MYAAFRYTCYQRHHNVTTTVTLFSHFLEVKAFIIKRVLPPVYLKELCSWVSDWSQVYSLSPSPFMRPIRMGSFAGKMVGPASMISNWMWPMEYEQKWKVPLPNWAFRASMVIPPSSSFLCHENVMYEMEVTALVWIPGGTWNGHWFIDGRSPNKRYTLVSHLDSRVITKR